MYLPRNFKICSQSCLLLVVPFGSRWGGRRTNDRSQGSDQQFWALRAGKWGKMMKDTQIIEADEKWWKIWHPTMSLIRCSILWRLKLQTLSIKPALGRSKGIHRHKALEGQNEALMTWLNFNQYATSPMVLYFPQCQIIVSISLRHNEHVQLMRWTGFKLWTTPSQKNPNHTATKELWMGSLLWHHCSCVKETNLLHKVLATANQCQLRMATLMLKDVEAV